MKICPRCKAEKPDAEFSPNPKTGRLQAYCKPCFRDYWREHRKAHPEQARERGRRWRQKHWDEAKRSMYAWRERNPDTWKANQKRWREKYLNDYMRDKRRRNRDLVFAHYGEQCACCGEKERLFLTIDHVTNNGAEHRRSLPGQIGKGGSSFFDWLVRKGFPEGFQTLCRNCNWGKHANGGVCPHQEH
jgi:hypothetical protein